MVAPEIYFSQMDCISLLDVFFYDHKSVVYHVLVHLHSQYVSLLLCNCRYVKVNKTLILEQFNKPISC